MWPDHRILDLFAVTVPIVQAPMAGSSGVDLAIAVTKAGGLGSLPCALVTPERVRADVAMFRKRTAGPLNLNFFCHVAAEPDPARDVAWKRRLAPYYAEFGLEVTAPPAVANRRPFDESMAALVAELRPEVVSFHFGLPAPELVERVRAAGAKVISSATTVAEARWLEARGADAIIAQGVEAGGHRGMFLAVHPEAQVGTFALVPQVADAVSVPVIAAGGIADARGIAAAFALGAAAVQIGTGYLRTPEALTGALHRAALAEARDDETVLTNVLTGRPARGVANRLVREVGPLTDLAPAFPFAAAGVVPLRAAAEAQGIPEFSPLWAGQAAALAADLPAGVLTQNLNAAALALMERLGAPGV